jgi:hypothetical protein
MILQTGEDVSEPSLRIDVVGLGSLCRTPNYAERAGSNAPFARTCAPSSGHCPSSVRYSLACHSVVGGVLADTIDSK